MLVNDISLDRVPRVELGQTNVIFNIPHPSLSLHVHNKTSRNVILLMIQEVKRDIIFRRMNLPPSTQQATAHGGLRRTLTLPYADSYLQYIGFVKYTEAATLLLRLREFNLAWGNPKRVTMLKFLFSMTQVYLSLSNTITCAQPTHSAQQIDYETTTSWKPYSHKTSLSPSHIQFCTL